MFVTFNPAIIGAIKRGERLGREDVQKQALFDLERRIKEFALQQEQALLPFTVQEAKARAQLAAQQAQWLPEFWKQEYQKRQFELEHLPEDWQLRTEMTRRQLAGLDIEIKTAEEKLKALIAEREWQEEFRKQMPHITEFLETHHKIREAINTIYHAHGIIASHAASGQPIPEEIPQQLNTAVQNLSTLADKAWGILHKIAPYLNPDQLWALGQSLLNLLDFQQAQISTLSDFVLQRADVAAREAYLLATSDTVEDVPDTAQAAPGAPKTAPGAPKTAPGAPKTAPGAPKTAPGAPKTAPGAPQAAPGVSQAAPGAPQNVPDVSQMNYSQIIGLVKQLPPEKQQVFYKAYMENLMYSITNSPINMLPLALFFALTSDRQATGNAFLNLMSVLGRFQESRNRYDINLRRIAIDLYNVENKWRYEFTKLFINAGLQEKKIKFLYDKLYADRVYREYIKPAQQLRYAAVQFKYKEMMEALRWVARVTKNLIGAGPLTPEEMARVANAFLHLFDIPANPFKSIEVGPQDKVKISYNLSEVARIPTTLVDMATQGMGGEGGPGMSGMFGGLPGASGVQGGPGGAYEGPPGGAGTIQVLPETSQLPINIWGRGGGSGVSPGAGLGWGTTAMTLGGGGASPDALATLSWLNIVAKARQNTYNAIGNLQYSQFIKLFSGLSILPKIEKNAFAQLNKKDPNWGYALSQALGQYTLTQEFFRDTLRYVPDVIKEFELPNRDDVVFAAAQKALTAYAINWLNHNYGTKLTWDNVAVSFVSSGQPFGQPQPGMQTWGGALGEATGHPGLRGGGGFLPGGFSPGGFSPGGYSPGGHPINQLRLWGLSPRYMKNLDQLITNTYTLVDNARIWSYFDQGLAFFVPTLDFLARQNANGLRKLVRLYNEAYQAASDRLGRVDWNKFWAALRQKFKAEGVPLNGTFYLVLTPKHPKNKTGHHLIWLFRGFKENGDYGFSPKPLSPIEAELLVSNPIFGILLGNRISREDLVKQLYGDNLPSY